MSVTAELAATLRGEADELERRADELVWKGLGNSAWPLYERADTARLMASRITHALSEDFARKQASE